MARKNRELSHEFPIHITGRSNNRDHFPIPLEQVWDVLSDYLHIVRYGFGVQLVSFVLMPNHFHLIVRDPELHLPQAMEFFMRETSKEIGRLSGRINKIWGCPYHSSVIKSAIYFLHAYKYVYRNPIKAKLVSSVFEYPFSSLQVLLGHQQSIIPLEHDDTLFSDLDSTLRWLDEAFDSEDEVSIQRGLRKCVFQLRQNPHSRGSSSLEDWESARELFRFSHLFPSR